MCGVSHATTIIIICSKYSRRNEIRKTKEKERRRAQWRCVLGWRKKDEQRSQLILYASSLVYSKCRFLDSRIFVSFYVHIKWVRDAIHFILYSMIHYTYWQPKDETSKDGTNEWQAMRVIEIELYYYELCGCVLCLVDENFFSFRYYIIN